MPDLFSPLQVGSLELPNRIWMAPLNSYNAMGDEDLHQAFMAPPPTSPELRGGAGASLCRGHRRPLETRA